MSSKREAKTQHGAIEERLDPEDVAGRLEALARGLREGRLTLEDTDFEAPTRGAIDFEAKAKHRKRRGSLKLRLRFRLAPDAATEGDERGDAPEATPAATLPDKFSF